MKRWWLERRATAIGLAAALSCALAALAFAEPRARPGASVTIHTLSSGYGGATYGGAADVSATASYGVIVEERDLELERGDNEVAIRGVSSRLEPSTARLRLVRGDEMAVHQQRFASGPSTPDAVLQQALGRRVEAVTVAGTIAGTLLAADAQQLVIDTGEGEMPLRIVSRGRHLRDLRMATATPALVTEPTLLWKIGAKKAGRRRVELSYRAAGLSWSADYAAVYDPARGRADVSAWATIDNRAGVDLRGAAVTLASTVRPPSTAGSVARAVQRATESGLTSVTLPRHLDVASGESVQVELFAPVEGAAARTVVLYEPLANVAYYATGYPNIDCYGYQYQPVRSLGDEYVELALPKDRPLLPGRSRLFRRQKGGQVALIGEDEVRRGAGTARFKIGQSRAIEGERRQLECQPNEQSKELREKIEVVVRNSSDERVEVIVREYMQRWTHWVIEAESVAGVSAGPMSREYRVMVPANGAKTIHYTVLYSW